MCSWHKLWVVFGMMELVEEWNEKKLFVLFDGMGQS